MITGKLMYDISIVVDNEIALKKLLEEIAAKLKSIEGINDTEEVDSDIEDDGDEE